ncbi:hypothetical protein AMIS_22280 [Actinoplanes missouriensis 431]|uniref:Uncharacterized protein n=1 Tax=Actinoplanes missouriensis (strain ATCC 14538 / DSM 43046 / CBS 188.64 / JCM 3121 / NBRC 102363 / NCIMB 12654 / NRRL B-3342 / UNCC 431) TaxID=512565 RepID=I0H361_ACTM4|nr:hypothetical protein [Actinoplanes missouriensis]BAL87448.1 hypothetical protein AMIS_22280 [Actinoplanes missouriensis 431]
MSARVLISALAAILFSVGIASQNDAGSSSAAEKSPVSVDSKGSLIWD